MSNLTSLTEAEVRDLAVEFYRKIDLHVPVEEFLSILTEEEEELKIILPNVEIKSFVDLRAWWDRMIRFCFDGSHNIYDVELVSASDTEAKAKILLIWEAKVWNPPAPKSERISILTYTTWTVKRSPKTQKPIVATYVLDAVKYAGGSVQRTPE